MYIFMRDAATTVASSLSSPQSTTLPHATQSTAHPASTPSAILPTAPPAPSHSSSGFTPQAVIGIVAGIVLLLFFTIITGALMRRNSRKRERKLLVQKTSSPQVKDNGSDSSLKGIMVTKVFETSTVASVKSGRSNTSKNNWEEGSRQDSAV